jgi:Fe-Mn family superoxide dismutase
MAITKPALPYAKDALAPHISEETMGYHYDKHHQAYVDKLNGLMAGTPFENSTLEEMILKADGGVFNNAAQVWNHTFYWHSLSPQGGGAPTGEIAALIDRDFGGFEQFKTAFTEAALTQFGSGWAFLVQDDAGTLRIVKTSNAGNPMTEGLHPLLTCDVWEHAYYIDTRNDRGAYLKNYWSLIHWDFANANLR